MQINRASVLSAALLVLSLTPAPSLAQGGLRQYSRQAMIGGKLPASILLVGYSSDAADIEKLFDIVLSRAGETYAKLDGANPSSEAAMLASDGKTASSPEVVAAFEAVRKVCDWTGGAFEVVTSGGSCRDIKVGKDSVEFRGKGAKLDLSPMIAGFMAEMMARLINAAGMSNAVVKVGNVFRGFGQGLTGPWKIQVQDDAGTFAHHALNLTVLNTGIATVSATQYRGSPAASSCRGTVAVMSDAALAEGVAYAAFRLGPEAGFKLLSSVAKGLVVDATGKFMRTPGF